MCTLDRKSVPRYCTKYTLSVFVKIKTDELRGFSLKLTSLLLMSCLVAAGCGEAPIGLNGQKVACSTFPIKVTLTPSDMTGNGLFNENRPDHKQAFELKAFTSTELGAEWVGAHALRIQANQSGRVNITSECAFQLTSNNDGSIISHDTNGNPVINLMTGGEFVGAIDIFAPEESI